MQNKKWQIVVLAVLVLLVVGTGLWWMQQQTPVAPPMRPIKKAAPAALPTETAKPTPKPDSGVAVPPITEINPRTVYSGNLGTLTGIQAGADIKKMELEFAQLSAKIKDLQKRKKFLLSRFLLFRSPPAHLLHLKRRSPPGSSSWPFAARMAF